MAFPQWIIGVLCTLVGSVVLNFGANLQRYSYLKNGLKPIEHQRIFIRQPLWCLGFGLFLAGNIADFIGLGYASQTIIAPLGSVALLSNSIYAPCFLKEKFHLRDLIATLSIIAGTVLVVIFGSHEDTHYELWPLLQLFLTPQTLAFLIIVAVAVIAMLILAFIAERIGRTRGHKYQLLAHKFLPFAYPVTGGILGSITVMFAKASSELMKTSIIDGNNQFKYGFTYLVLAICAGTAIGQVFFLNRSLKRYDATYCIPVYYGAWVAFSITGGSLYFMEFENFTALSYAMYFLGVGIMIVGVIILSRRIAQGETSTAQVGIAPGAAERAAETTDDTRGLLAAEDEDAELASQKGDDTPILSDSPVITVELHALKN